MEIEVLEERENKYLDRIEIRLSIRHPRSSTPRREEVFNYIVNKFSLKPENTILMYIKTIYGENRSEALIYYYPNGVDWSTIEPTKRKKVMKIGEEESEEKSEET